MSDGRRPMDRYLDRLERLLIRSNEEYKAERKQRRAAERKKSKRMKDEQQTQVNHLNIKSEVDYIAFLHDVVFSFES